MEHAKKFIDVLGGDVSIRDFKKVAVSVELLCLDGETEEGDDTKNCIFCVHMAYCEMLQFLKNNFCTGIGVKRGKTIETAFLSLNPHPSSLTEKKKPRGNVPGVQ
jgi:hypothetical protein